MLFQRDGDERFFSACEAFVVVHRHLNFLHGRAADSILPRSLRSITGFAISLNRLIRLRYTVARERGAGRTFFNDLNPPRLYYGYDRVCEFGLRALTGMQCCVYPFPD